MNRALPGQISTGLEICFLQGTREELVCESAGQMCSVLMIIYNLGILGLERGRKTRTALLGNGPHLHTDLVNHHCLLPQPQRLWPDLTQDGGLSPEPHSTDLSLPSSALSPDHTDGISSPVLQTTPGLPSLVFTLHFIAEPIVPACPQPCIPSLTTGIPGVALPPVPLLQRWLAVEGVGHLPLVTFYLLSCSRTCYITFLAFPAVRSLKEPSPGFLSIR